MISLFFAVNIGASGTAASMAPAYGSGAVPRRSTALALAGIAVAAGALFGGAPVSRTIGGGLVPSRFFTAETVIIVLAAASTTLFAANLLGVPLSTSEVAVGSIVGLGLAEHALRLGHVLLIVGVWLAMPAAAFVIARGITRWHPWLRRQLLPHPLWGRRLAAGLLTATGCAQAFAAGMNNVANAIGPLTGAHLTPLRSSLAWGAVFVGLGAFLLGGRVLDTNAKKLAQWSLLDGGSAALISGVLTALASLEGLPVPLTQASTMAILGLQGPLLALPARPVALRVLRIWVISPIASLLVSYTAVDMLTNSRAHFPIALLALLAAGWGLHALRRRSRPQAKGEPRAPKGSDH
jgi:sulfate permease